MLLKLYHVSFSSLDGRPHGQPLNLANDLL